MNMYLVNERKDIWYHLKRFGFGKVKPSKSKRGDYTRSIRQRELLCDAVEKAVKKKYWFFIKWKQAVPIVKRNPWEGVILIQPVEKPLIVLPCKSIIDPSCKNNIDFSEQIKKDIHTIQKTNNMDGLPNIWNGEGLLYWHPYEGDLCCKCAAMDDLWLPFLYNQREWQVRCKFCKSTLSS